MTELARLQAAYRNLCTHLRDVHHVEPGIDSASHLEAQHHAAHAREATPWHSDAWQLPDPDDPHHQEAAR